MKYYVDASGLYLGGYNLNPPANSIEVPAPPKDIRMRWDGSAFVWPLDAIKTVKHEEAKAEAERRIDLIAESTRAKLRDLMYVVMALEQGMMALDAGQPVPQAVKDALAPIKTKGAQIQAVLDAQVAIDAEVDALTTVAEVEAYDVAGNPLWP